MIHWYWWRGREGEIGERMSGEVEEEAGAAWDHGGSGKRRGGAVGVVGGVGDKKLLKDEKARNCFLSLHEAL